MRPIQEAYLQLLGEGLSKSEACRRLSLGRSLPGYWAQQEPEFEAAYRPYRGTLCKRNVQVDVPHELTEMLIAQGFVEEAHAEQVESALTTYFVRIGALQFADVKASFNRAVRSPSEQKRLVDAYIELKRSAAGTTHGLHAFLVEHRISVGQIGRWAVKLYGKGALNVGPYQCGFTKKRVLECVILSQECTPRDVAEKTGINLHTVREYLRALAKSGRVQKLFDAGRVRYAAA